MQQAKARMQRAMEIRYYLDDNEKDIEELRNQMDVLEKKSL